MQGHRQFRAGQQTVSRRVSGGPCREAEPHPGLGVAVAGRCAHRDGAQGLGGAAFHQGDVLEARSGDHRAGVLPQRREARGVRQQPSQQHRPGVDAPRRTARDGHGLGLVRRPGQRVSGGPGCARGARRIPGSGRRWQARQVARWSATARAPAVRTPASTGSSSRFEAPRQLGHQPPSRSLSPSADPTARSAYAVWLRHSANWDSSEGVAAPPPERGDAEEGVHALEQPTQGTGVVAPGGVVEPGALVFVQGEQVHERAELVVLELVHQRRGELLGVVQAVGRCRRRPARGRAVRRNLSARGRGTTDTSPPASASATSVSVRRTDVPGGAEQFLPLGGGVDRFHPARAAQVAVGVGVDARSRVQPSARSSVRACQSGPRVGARRSARIREGADLGHVQSARPGTRIAPSAGRTTQPWRTGTSVRNSRPTRTAAAAAIAWRCPVSAQRGASSWAVPRSRRSVCAAHTPTAGSPAGLPPSSLDTAQARDSNFQPSAKGGRGPAGAVAAESSRARTTSSRQLRSLARRRSAVGGSAPTAQQFVERPRRQDVGQGVWQNVGQGVGPVRLVHLSRRYASRCGL